MSALALVLYVGYLALAFGWRSWLLRRATGDAGFRGISGRPGSAEWLGGVAFVVALVLGLVAPVAAGLGLAELDLPVVVGWAGAALTVAGTAVAVASQVAMGASWRVGVDAAERTDLVHSGPFALVRNPFFAATVLAATGLALMVPNALALAGLVVLLVAVQLQVRVVEEPYLLATHGPAYRTYAARAGRFLPGVGRLGPGTEGAVP